MKKQYYTLEVTDGSSPDELPVHEIGHYVIDDIHGKKPTFEFVKEFESSYPKEGQA